jgi:MoxR-like ATPase
VGKQKAIYQKSIKTRKAYFYYPPPLAHFAGREEILEVLTQKLIGIGNHDPVILCGQAGMGKSELAKYFAFKERAHYDLIFWMLSDTQDNLLQSYVSLAEVLARLTQKM